MTPVVFLISGLIFMATAATYTEATTMYPEAGGSSSFARRAFNEFWSFFAARSEEHTSELQSRPHLVCRLLLEKKKPSHPGRIQQFERESDVASRNRSLTPSADQAAFDE